MKFRKSIIRHYLNLSLLAGVLMGAIFPLFSLLFVDKFKNSTMFIIFTLSCIIAGITVGFISFFVGNITIIGFIKQVAAELKDLSEGSGNLTKRLKIQSDDSIGELSVSFNKFVERLHNMVDTITVKANTVAASATELSAVSSQIASNAEVMNTRTSTITSATGEITSSINLISTSASEMSSSTNSVTMSIEEMSNSFNNVTLNCQKELTIVKEANTHAKNSKEVMDKLGEAAREIGNVVEVINTIAAQTNLLALNATIEAARAGAAGKGFAIVANEVKELSTQTSEATQQIQQQIKNMQLNSESAICAIEKVSKEIEEVNTVSQLIVQVVEDQHLMVSEILGNVTGLKENALEVSNGIAISATNLNEVTSTSASVNNAVADTTKGILQVKTSAEDLSKLSEELMELVRQFRI
jgi:methyl-accepting chemotaxis protein